MKLSLFFTGIALIFLLCSEKVLAQGNEMFDRSSFINQNDSLYELASTAYKNGDTEKSLQILKSINSGVRNYAVILNAILALEYENKNYTSVLEYAKFSKTLGTASIRKANCYEALIEMQKNNFEKALFLWDSNLQLTQIPDVVSMYRKAFCLFQLGRIDEAKVVAENCALIGFKGYDIHVLLSEIYLAQGRVSEAFMANQMAFVLLHDFSANDNKSKNILKKQEFSFEDINFEDKPSIDKDLDKLDAQISAVNTKKMTRTHRNTLYLELIKNGLEYKPENESFTMQTYVPLFINALNNDASLLKAFATVTASGNASKDLFEPALWNKYAQASDILVDAAEHIQATQVLHYVRGKEAPRKYVSFFVISNFKAFEHYFKELAIPIPRNERLDVETFNFSKLYIDGFLYLEVFENNVPGTSEMFRLYQKYSTLKDYDYAFLNNRYDQKVYFGATGNPTDTIVHDGDHKIYEKVYSDFGILLKSYEFVAPILYVRTNYPTGKLKQGFDNNYLKKSLLADGYFANGRKDFMYDVGTEKNTRIILNGNKYGNLIYESRQNFPKENDVFLRYFSDGTLKSKKTTFRIKNKPSVDSVFLNGKLNYVNHFFGTNELVGTQTYWNQDGKQYGAIFLNTKHKVDSGYFLNEASDTIWKYSGKDIFLPIYDEQSNLTQEYGLTFGVLNGSLTKYYLNGEIMSTYDKSINRIEGFTISGVPYFRIDSIPNSVKKSRLSYSAFNRLYKKEITLNELPSGERERYYNNGMLAQKGFFDQNNIEDGDFFYYDTDGQIRYSVTYKYGIILKLITYNLKGDIIRIQNLNTPNQPLEIFNHNDKMVATFERVNGLFLGHKKSFFENGQLRNHSYFKGDTMYCLNFFPDGNLKYTTIYIGGNMFSNSNYMLGNQLDEVYSFDIASEENVRISQLFGPRVKPTSQWLGEGNRIERLVLEQDTLLQINVQDYVVMDYWMKDQVNNKRIVYKVTNADTLIEIRDKEGNVVFLQGLDRRTLQGLTKFYDNNRLVYDYAFKYKDEFSPTKIYYPSGQLRYEFARRYGVDDGVSRCYAEDGKLLIEAHYLEGELYGDYKYWDAKSQTYKTVNVDYNIFPELDQVY